MPVWWSIGRIAVILVVLVSAVGVAEITDPDFLEAQDAVLCFSTWDVLRLVAGLVVLFVPYPDSDLIASARTEIGVRQLHTFVGCLLIGVVAVFVNCCMAFARVVEWPIYLLYGTAAIGVYISPVFYRLPFGRIAVAVLLFASVLLPLHLRNFF